MRVMQCVTKIFQLFFPNLPSEGIVTNSRASGTDSEICICLHFKLWVRLRALFSPITDRRQALNDLEVSWLLLVSDARLSSNSFLQFLRACFAKFAAVSARTKTLIPHPANTELPFLLCVAFDVNRCVVVNMCFLCSMAACF